MWAMERSVIVRDDRFAWDDGEGGSVPLSQYAARLTRLADQGEKDEPIPTGVRFLIHRYPASLLVIEEPPHVRMVQWIADGSTEPFGPQAEYRRVRLAFPYVVIIAVFLHGSLTTRTQCFYRTAPLTGRSDRLLVPNMHNVDRREDLPCWLCLKKLDRLSATESWKKKVEFIRQHFWNATFNRSAALNLQHSYYWKMKRLDPRIAKLDAWETASRENPLFPLDVPWLPVAQTLGEIMTLMLDKTAAPHDPQSLLESMMKWPMETTS